MNNNKSQYIHKLKGDELYLHLSTWLNLEISIEGGGGSTQGYAHFERISVNFENKYKFNTNKNLHILYEQVNIW